MDEPLLVLARWTDAYYELDPPPDGDRASYVVETVGFVTRDDETWLSIAAERTPDGPRAVTHIPRPCVIEAIPLRPARNRHADPW